MSGLENQNVFVVGGATGIGEAVAGSLSKCGCNVAIGGRRLEKLEAASKAFEGPGTLQVCQIDVADRESVTQAVAWFQQTIGDIDILVNAAGINIKDRSMATMKPDEWDKVIGVNATGAYNIMAAVLPSMRDRKTGTIINISSIAGKRAIELGGIAYCASKFAMTALGTAAGQEEAENGIRITNVYPGEVDTPLLLQRPKPVSEEHRQRMLQPQDVAELVVTICQLPARAHVPEIVIKPRLQTYF
jgi:NADP-dependent 3-hydroxy acid dehydrogenase YdfG